jgi:hypothetical protein
MFRTALKGSNEEMDIGIPILFDFYESDKNKFR